MSEKQKDLNVPEDLSEPKKATRGRKKKTQEPEQIAVVEKKPKRKTSEKSSTQKENTSIVKKVEKIEEIEARVVFQQGGYQLEPKLILERAKADWFAKGHKESELKSIELYIKPEEWSAYYVINGEGGTDNKLDLNIGLVE